MLFRLGDRYVKCADLVDDAPEYQALIGLAQPFRRRYPLVDGRGNFGSVDGDPPADAPYTEARLAPIAHALQRFPNLLVNGSRTIPPHNLREVAAAVIARLENPDADVSGLLRPDFPTGGVIADPSSSRAVYETGTGAITVRARAHVESDTIVVTELPYRVDKGGDEGVIRQIADLYHDGVLAGLRDLEDHSDRSGMRIAIRLRRGADPHAVLDTLHAHTSLETTFAADLVAMVDGEPQRLTLRELIDGFLAGRDPASVRSELSDVADRFGDERRTF